MKRGALIASFLISATTSFSQTNAPQKLDLATALRLAGAENLDIKLAGERLREAQANYEQARMKFLPSIAPGLGYKRHEGRTQNVEGEIIDASKQSASLGVSLSMNLDLGEARYQSLAAKQLVTAAAASIEIRQQDATFTAATGYFELLRAQGAIAAAQDAVRIAEDYAAQVGRAVSAGLAFKGDAARAEVQVEKNRMLLRQTEEFRDVAVARLAHALRLPAATLLSATDAELVPVSMTETSAALDEMIARAIASRPELRELASRRAAAVEGVRGEKDGRTIPEISASAFAGGLGGGTGGNLDAFGASSDLAIGLNWRFGPGGFFDKGSLTAAESRERSAALAEAKTRDDIVRDVVEARAHVRSLADQIDMARRGLEAAEQAHAFSVQRREFGIGAVMEAVQSEQDLTRARLDVVSLIAAHNQAQFALRRATGSLAKP